MTPTGTPPSQPQGDNSDGRPLLPVLGQPPPMRADAARNRARLLDAAARLVAEHGVADLTMDAVACAAKVGKGTLFRRFGDRTGLLLALLDHSERVYQESFLYGPPPLGPGAPPADRLRAFGVATFRHIADQWEIQLAAEGDALRRHLTPPARLRRAHVYRLLREAECPGDAELLTEALLAFVDVSLFNHLTRQRGMPVERLEATWDDLVTRVLGPAAR